MCGLSGIINLNNKPIKNLEQKINLMTKLLNHRGPDYAGKYINKKSSFGFSNNRLAIVSPKENIKLPYSKDGVSFLSYNGEIYNYLELQKFLKKKGINCKTRTDTEVMWHFLKSFLDKKNFQSLNGMWAYAFYNEKSHQLDLGRDLLGERHIFYYLESDNLFFSSEVKPILYVSEKKHQIDELSILESWRYNSCSNGRTLIKNVFKIEPGYNLKISKSKINKFRLQKLDLKKWTNYFQKTKNEKKIYNQFNKLIKQEVSLRIPKDVPFFSTLSGGIDSSIIAYNLRKIKKKIKTIFCYSKNSQIKKNQFEEFSELDLSKIVARKFKLTHKAVNIAHEKKVLSKTKIISQECFEGCIDPGLINFTMMSNYLRSQKIKVGLMSEGPDEFLGGYHTDQEAFKVDNLYSDLKNKKINKKIFKSSFKKLKLRRNKFFNFDYDKFKTRVVHFSNSSQFIDSKLNHSKKFSKLNSFNDVNLRSIKKNSSLSFSQMRALNYAEKTIPDMINMRKDKSMMLNSVEPRFPFLAKNIVEFLISMPDKYRFRKNYGKFFLREYCKKFIDKNVAWYPKKGLGDYTWNYIENFFKKIDAKKVIFNSRLFKKKIFKTGICEAIFGNKLHKANIWTAYVLARTYANLEKINKIKTL